MKGAADATGRVGAGEGNVQGPERPTDGGSPADADHLGALPPGTRIGKYELLAVLGQGGFAITYRARDTQLNREVAVKEYMPSVMAVRHGGTQVLPRSTRLAGDFMWGRERFLEEARALATLERLPAVVGVHDFLEANGTAYMVMSLVRGETLEDRLAREGRLRQPAIERLLYPLLDGLEKVHAHHYLHRDIKPANISIDADGLPTLLDFGAARAAIAGRTQTFTAVYTPGYAPLEQVMSEPQGPWTDIYALAATLYRCVTGELPPNPVNRLRNDTMVPVMKAGEGRYAPSLLAGIDAGLTVDASARPQTIAAWRRVFDTGMTYPPGAPAAAVPAVAPTVDARRASVGAGGASGAGASANPATRHDRPRLASRRTAGLVVLAVVLVAGGLGAYAWITQERARVESQLKTDEANRKAEEQARRTAEATRLKGEDERKAAEARRAEDERKAAEARRAEDERKAAEARRAEDERKAAEARRAEDERKAADARRAEDERKAAEARRIEDERKAAEARRAEDERKAAEARRAEDERKAAEARRAEDERKAAEARRIEDERRSSQRAPVPGLRTQITGETFRAVLTRGYVNCGVAPGLEGFSISDGVGKWRGLDVDVCRAIAAALFGDGGKARFVPLSLQNRFTALQSGEVDLMVRATTWTLTRDTALGFDFPAVTFYDGQGFMVPRKLGVRRATELNGATVCVTPSTTSELNVADYFRANRMAFKAVLIERTDELRQAFFSGRCDAYTADTSALYAARAYHAPVPGDYIILPEVISKEPLGPLVRHGDQQWGDLVRWTVNTMITAEEYGITARTLEQAKRSDSPLIRTFLGVTPVLGGALAVRDDWAEKIIAQVGNYGEAFERNVGQGSPLKMERGLNALWTNGGLLYAPPMR